LVSIKVKHFFHSHNSNLGVA